MEDIQEVPEPLGTISSKGTITSMRGGGEEFGSKSESSALSTYDCDNPRLPLSICCAARARVSVFMSLCVPHTTCTLLFSVDEPAPRTMRIHPHFVCSTGY